MEQRKEIVNRFVHQGLRVQVAIDIAGISRSSFYYKPNGRKSGKAASKFTLLDGKYVSNEQVVAVIKEIHGEEFIDYGYHRTTKVLRKKAFVINPKKVYRLMHEHHLLQGSLRARKAITRKFVQFTCPPYQHPFATIEIDIKYIYLANPRRTCYLVTAIDTFTRMALAWDLAYSMKHDRIIELVEEIIKHPLVQPYIGKINISIRTDNGSQFIAQLLQTHIKQAGLEKEFIRPATPQQNAHIESFHSTLQRLVVDRYELSDHEEALEVLKQFYHTYNHSRIMESIADCTPVEFLKAWENGKIEIREVKRKQKFFFRERQVSVDAALSREDFFGCIKNTP